MNEKNKPKHYHYFELNKGDAYFLYDGVNLTKMDFPLVIGDERKVKNEVTRLPKNVTISYYELLDTKIAKDGVEFKFKKIFTKIPEKQKEDK
jgi:hypothetical protein